MPNAIELTEQQITTIARRYDDGETLKKIAFSLDVDRCVVKRALGIMGISARDSSQCHLGQKAHNCIPWTDEQMKVIANRYLNGEAV